MPPPPLPSPPTQTMGEGASKPDLSFRRFLKGVIKVLPFSSIPRTPPSPHTQGKLPGDLSGKSASYCLSELSERKTAQSAVTWTLIFRDWRDCHRARARAQEGTVGGARRILPAGPWSPDPGRTQTSGRFQPVTPVAART